MVLLPVFTLSFLKFHLSASAAICATRSAALSFFLGTLANPELAFAREASSEVQGGASRRALGMLLARVNGLAQAE